MYQGVQNRVWMYQGVQTVYGCTRSPKPGMDVRDVCTQVWMYRDVCTQVWMFPGMAVPGLAVPGPAVLAVPGFYWFWQKFPVFTGFGRNSRLFGRIGREFRVFADFLRKSAKIHEIH